MARPAQEFPKGRNALAPALRRPHHHPVAWMLLFLFAAGASLGAELESGKPVEAFRITTLEGARISPASQRGRVLVINLWATWCAPCRQEMPAIEAFYRKYRQRGVDVVAISVDDRSDIAEVGKLMASYSFPAALAVDSDLKAFGRMRHVPATFVIDRNGVLRRNGWADAGPVDLATLENAVEPLLHPASR
jgi:thiol-disulfide isomerase/thioredoxin